MAQGQRSVYTCPIKALVNEKFMALCREFGPDNVGLSTGDASVNRDAPILCCTAEILANIALREGAAGQRAGSGHGRIPLLRRPRARRGLAGAVADPAASAVSPDVRHAGRHDVFRGGAYPAQRAADSHGCFHGAAGAVGTCVLRDAAGQDAGKPGRRAARRRSMWCISPNWRRRRARRISPASTSAPARKRPRWPPRWKGSSSAALTVRKSKSGCGTASACIMPGCCPNTACWSSNWRKRGCSRSSAARTPSAWASTCPSAPCCSPASASMTARRPASSARGIFTRSAAGPGARVSTTAAGWWRRRPEHVVENLKLGKNPRGTARKPSSASRRRRISSTGTSTPSLRLIAAPPERLTSRFQVSHGMLFNVLSRQGDGCRAMQRLIARLPRNAQSQEGPHQARLAVVPLAGGAQDHRVHPGSRLTAARTAQSALQRRS